MIPKMEQGGFERRTVWLYCALALGILILTSCQSLEYYRGAGKFDTILLDAGHGGYDYGGRAAFGVNEKMLTLDIVLRLAPILSRAGYHVILTRNNDEFISLGKRTAISNVTTNSIFVSIHINWSDNRRARGLETYYYAPNSQRLASNILWELSRVCATPIRGVKFAKYHVLRYNSRPAVLCELGFDSNSSENRLLQNEKHRQLLAEAVARGILQEARGRIP